MKTRKRFSKFVSLILTIALVLGMLPITASASQLVPQTADYKGFSMENLNNGAWISYDKFWDMKTIFFRPINLNGGQTWTKLTFTIELSQYVSLELYKIKDEYVRENLDPRGQGDDAYSILPLKYQAAEGEDVTLESLREDFLDGDPIGYLRGVTIQDQVKPAEGQPDNIEDALYIEQSDTPLDWKNTIKK